MNSLKQIIRQLQHYLSIRRIGKTTLLRVGVDDYPKYHCIVVPNIEYAKQAFNPINKLHNFISLDNLDSLSGTNQAMIIDQEANLQIFTMVLDELDKLDNLIQNKDNTIAELNNIKDEYYSELTNLKNHLNNGYQIRWWQFKKCKEHKLKQIQLLK